MTLTPSQTTFFHENGYLVVENAVSQNLLRLLRQQFLEWVEESKQHHAAFGETINHKPRFDLSQEHSADQPCLRRVNAPVEISEAYWNAVTESRIPVMITQLIGENIRFHHSKINSKLPGSGTEVKWHQDFAFTPHTNSDLVTALLMIDEVTAENGPLQVLPGSHLSEVHSLWHNGVFTGAVAKETADYCEKHAIECTGNAGSVCLMHTKLLHGSKPNRSNLSRTLLISVYAAADSMPCSPNPMPSKFEGKLLNGVEPGTVRCCELQLDLPELPGSASFFDQQTAAQVESS